MKPGEQEAAGLERERHTLGMHVDMRLGFGKKSTDFEPDHLLNDRVLVDFAIEGVDDIAPVDVFHGLT